MRVDDMLSGNVYNDSLDNAIDKEIYSHELMGYDLDDNELLGNIFSRIRRRIQARRKGKKGLIRRIVSRIKRRKRAGLKRSDRGYGLSVMTPEGTASLGPEGLTYQDRVRMMKAGLISPTQETTGIMDQVSKNPLLLAIPAAFLFMFAMKKKYVLKVNQ